jgi:hypothetical protein
VRDFEHRLGFSSVRLCSSRSAKGEEDDPTKRLLSALKSDNIQSIQDSRFTFHLHSYGLPPRQGQCRDSDKATMTYNHSSQVYKIILKCDHKFMLLLFRTPMTLSLTSLVYSLLPQPMLSRDPAIPLSASTSPSEAQMEP